ncbi:hypothetical protein EVAR_94142_1 [Eumeta japonica]|uniref:Uncharacterized protein n=1 Tax=Eumeta variegata TaxID=151549 RepID=A0A4C1U6U8_EUMVA|nr:hypothetical protein EVAR_94142_1 [Eumeta japonica]
MWTENVVKVTSGNLLHAVQDRAASPKSRLVFSSKHPMAGGSRTASAIPEPIVISEPNVDESIEFESVEPVSCNSEDSCVAEEDVSNNITDDDEDDDDSVGQYHDWLNDENSNNCYDDCDD